MILWAKTPKQCKR